MRNTIWIDFDGPLCNIWVPWLGRYNERFDDSVQPSDIKTWDTHLYVKPEARHAIYDILNEPDLYDDAPMQPGAIEAIEEIESNGLQWMIATSCTSEAMVSGKVRWLKRHGLARRETRGGWPCNLVPISDKGLLRGVALIDDAAHNLEGFGGERILWHEAHNANSPISGGYWRANGWREVMVVLRGVVFPTMRFVA